MIQSCLYYFGVLVVVVLACGIVARVLSYFEGSERLLYVFYAIRVFIDVGKFVGAALLIIAAFLAGYSVLEYIIHSIL